MMARALVIVKYFMLASRGWAYAGISYSLMFPVLWLFLLGLVGNKDFGVFFLVGSVVSTIFVIPFISSAQEAAYLKYGSTQYSLLFSNGAGHWDIMAGVVATNLIYALPSVPALLYFSSAWLGIRLTPAQFASTSLISIFIGLASAMLGYSMGVGSRNYLAVNQATQVVVWPLLLLAPVYYPESLIPEPLRGLAYLLPTTHMALSIRGVLQLNPAAMWTGFVGLSAYFAAAAAIVIYSIKRGERYG